MKTLAALAYTRKKRLQKRRFLVKAFIFALAWCLILLVAADKGAIARGEKENMLTVVVSGGDTLWTLAEKYAPGGQDLRSYIEQVKEVNNLPHAVIHPGQTLHLP